MTQKPLISVIMSVFNGEKFLRQAIDSILKQTIQDFEFIIIDDGSKDESLNIIKSYNDERIVIIENQQNIGLVGSLKKGIEAAQGNFIARMDADDVCLPNRFEKQLSYFNEYPDVSFVGSSVIFFDGEGYEFIGYQPTNHDEIKCELLLGFTMLHPSVMMRKSFLDQNKINYNTDFLYGEDHDLWVRCIRLTQFANIHEPLIKMREHTNKLTKNFRGKYIEYSNKIRERQLIELGVIYCNEELSVFSNLSSNIAPKSIFEITLLDTFLIKILESNKETKIFNQPILESICAFKYRVYCNELLRNRNKLGLIYWKSKIRKFDKLSFRSKLGMAYHSTRTIISL